MYCWPLVWISVKATAIFQHVLLFVHWQNAHAARHQPTQTKMHLMLFLQADIHCTDLAAWQAAMMPGRGISEIGNMQPASRQEYSTLSLFSLNDYLGLSTHPDVCKAAAEAALQVSNGTLLCTGLAEATNTAVSSTFLISTVHCVHHRPVPAVCKCYATCYMLYDNFLAHPIQVGMGPRSSALVGGFTQLHRDLETDIARLKGTEDCLLFPTGERQGALQVQ